jgi:hypothetical protein
MRTHIHAAGRAGIERALTRLLRDRRVGTITQVSIVDRLANAGRPDESGPADYAQLRSAAIPALEALRRVLGVNPVTIAARCTTPPWRGRPHGATTDALVEMEADIHVHYYGSLVASHDEFTIRVHGDRGVLRSSLRHISWRKRGWPVFVPIWVTVGRGGMLQHHRPGSGGEGARWSAAMTFAAIRSDRTGRIVPIADGFAEAEPMNSAPAASAQR